MTSPLVVDIHTHVYPPSYMELLRSRKTVPYIHDPANGTPRLIILSSDDDPSVPLDERGRPVDSSYSDVNVKLSFMRRHGINSSVISLANPWLDFLEPEEAQVWAERINDDLEETCARVNQAADKENTLALNEKETLFAFGSLPLSAPNPDIVVNEIKRLKTLPHLRGVIMGTSGLGKGLDDPALDPVWAALQETESLMFLHPHYGLPDEAFGGADVTNRYGHVLPLALGFPLETTIAVTRMFLSGVFDRFPGLRILLAHSGGTLPFLAGRIESCIHHERKFVANGGDQPGLQKSVWDVLQTNIYLDAVVYGTAGLKAAVTAAGSPDRLMFGTDHPFFPPLDNDQDAEWVSVTTNYKAISAAFATDKEAVEGILGGNAARILSLK
ncbi:amidohydrolase family protein [Aspergillus clavatus NRRL 1]|uniref:2-amino-3-carboxymuconate-6-semialdehyde decarboxylase, putative n=1 Tax=Aspergillus clavatus (strain ATCC 1007 / CBS 513.65 / DSM 816 / NCTC 3887 / NRRL 1 / QM 1276 / 107) TaxID=344612 RepID=A1CBJ2_ASPCL|nr:2-amino-3-carboxymuconate-6-semialdehyde decarboxylase, putative [Aspergillus clavatus NRRL 1]EAW13110.1 2-amino-3-carboxymuconate-6-semialdehyde decarboxylase, putative [Aspergillus clavatus NRRL 1]